MAPDKTTEAELQVLDQMLPVPPRKLRLRLRADGVIELRGEVGRSYRLEYTETLPASPWTTETSLLLTNSPVLVSPAGGLGRPARFYRALQLP